VLTLSDGDGIGFRKQNSGPDSRLIIGTKKRGMGKDHLADSKRMNKSFLKKNSRAASRGNSRRGVKGEGRNCFDRERRHKKELKEHRRKEGRA